MVNILNHVFAKKYAHYMKENNIMIYSFDYLSIIIQLLVNKEIKIRIAKSWASLDTLRSIYGNHNSIQL